MENVYRPITVLVQSSTRVLIVLNVLQTRGVPGVWPVQSVFTARVTNRTDSAIVMIGCLGVVPCVTNHCVSMRITVRVMAYARQQTIALA